MGGNALKHHNSVRITPTTYSKFTPTFIKPHTLFFRSREQMYLLPTTTNRISVTLTSLSKIMLVCICPTTTLLLNYPISTVRLSRSLKPDP